MAIRMGWSKLGGSTMNEKTNPPIAWIMSTIAHRVANRSTDLIQKAEKGEITHQEYLSKQFPADIGSFLEDSVKEATKTWKGWVDAD